MPAIYIDINKAVVDRCRTGDRKAQYELYHLYARQMYNVCMRIVNNTGDAEDILQESFLDAFKNINEFRGESSFGLWLKRIVINRAINHLKKRRLALAPDTAVTEDLLHEDGIANEDELQYDVRRVQSALQELPTGYRLVLNLYLLEGYDHGEIAQILNITESTSKSQYNRGKARLRALLKGKLYEG